MSKVQVDKVVNLSDDGAPQLTYGAELPVGYGLTGAGGLNITGVVTAASAVFSGNVTIGGTLTYEDVTNIDVVGVSTFAGRMNVNSSALFNEGLRVTAGVTTISGTSTFSDDVTFTGAAANVTWDKSVDDLIFNDNAKAAFGTGSDLTIYHDGSHSFISDSGTGGIKVLASDVYIKNASDADMIHAQSGGAVKIYHNGNQKFETTNDGTVTTGIGTFTGSVAIDATFSEATTDANDIVIGSTSDTQKGISIVGSTSGGIGNLYFTDGQGYKNQGRISYHHADDSLRFTANGSEALRVDSSQRLLIGTSDTDSISSGEVSKVIVKGTDSTASASFTRHSANADGTGIYFGKSRNATIGSNTIVQSGDELGRVTFSGDDGTDINSMAARIQAFVDGTPGVNDMPGRLTFSTSADGSITPTERLRIDSSGNFWLNSSGSYNTDRQVFNADGTSGLVEATNELNIFQNKSSSGGLYIGYKDIANGGTITDYHFYTGQGNDTKANISCANLAVAAGGGIDFSAQTASSTATTAGELLDHYEYGTWTPTIEGQSSAGTATYPQRRGDYTKIGNRVFVNCYISYNSGSGSGNLIVAGLPFNVKNVSACDHAGAIMMSNITINNADDVCSICSYTGNNLTKVWFYTTRSAATYTALSYDVTGEIIFSLSYNTK